MDPTGIVCQSRHEKQSGVLRCRGNWGNVYFEGSVKTMAYAVGWSNEAGSKFGNCRFGYGFYGTE